jgi:hypothetical protein
MAKKPILQNKKKQIRNMRQSAAVYPDGTRESHKMAWEGDPTKKRGDFKVFPTIAPKPGKEKSTNPSDWKSQTLSEAQQRGEVVNVRSRRKAEKLSAGSWKKGQDKKEAMKAYKEYKKTKPKN